MSSTLEKIYSPRHTVKDALGGGSSGFEKERIRQFLKWVGDRKEVLDIGCRDGRIARHLLSAGNRVTGFDVDRAALNRCPPEMKTEWHDLNEDWHVNYQNRFDVVVATEVIEHLYYPEVVIRKIKSVLKPGGVFVGSVPNPFNIKNRIRLLLGEIRNTPLAEPTHINHFSYSALQRLLANNFEEVEICGIARPRWRFLADRFPGLGGSLLIFKGKKPHNVR